MVRGCVAFHLGERAFAYTALTNKALSISVSLIGDCAFAQYDGAGAESFGNGTQSSSWGHTGNGEGMKHNSYSVRVARVTGSRSYPLRGTITVAAASRPATDGGRRLISSLPFQLSALSRFSAGREAGREAQDQRQA